MFRNRPELRLSPPSPPPPPPTLNKRQRGEYYDDYYEPYYRDFYSNKNPGVFIFIGGSIILICALVLLSVGKSQNSSAQERNKNASQQTLLIKNTMPVVEDQTKDQKILPKVKMDVGVPSNNY
jgi:hypothetical protein